MAGESKITTDHEEIRKWTEERGGKPAVVVSTLGKGEGVGVIRIKFPEYSEDKTLKEISWESFFKTFEEKNLAFLFQEETKTGQKSRFFKFVGRK